MNCRRPTYWIVLLAWAAQLCMPLAHAAAMAQNPLNASAWCGPSNTAMRAKLAQLPDEVARIIAPDQGANLQQGQCAQSCASVLGAAIGPASSPWSFDDQGTFDAHRLRRQGAHHSVVQTLLARGPPQFS